jgi:two-component system, OmpR family, alkaline phosphatase synthesis response regulator PhoP
MRGCARGVRPWIRAKQFCATFGRPTASIDIAGLEISLHTPSVIQEGIKSAPALSSNPIHEPGLTARERILVIEDDRAVQKALKRLFECEGYSVDLATDGSAGLEMFRKMQPSALVLDLRLPGMSGQDVCREITQIAPGLPIVILSAKSEVTDKVLLLEIGAHDYVTKPFSPRELLVRVRAALRRSARVDVGDFFVFADVAVNFAKMEVVRGGESIPLTSQEFKTLKFMVQNPERVISRDELLNQVWGYQNYPSTRTVDNHILKLRQKLEGDPSNPVHFRTSHGAGYKFVP